MRIAVTYDNGQVDQHFGMAECVKIYEVESEKVISTEIVNLPSAGHSIIAGTIFGQAANVVICGNIKPSAASGLEMSGIKIFAGVQGSADEAVEALIKGTLVNNQAAYTADETCGHDH